MAEGPRRAPFQKIMGRRRYVAGHSVDRRLDHEPSFRAGLEDPHPEIVRTEVREPMIPRRNSPTASEFQDALDHFPACHCTHYCGQWAPAVGDPHRCIGLPAKTHSFRAVQDMMETKLMHRHAATQAEREAARKRLMAGTDLAPYGTCGCGQEMDSNGCPFGH